MRLIDADALMDKAEYDEWYRLIVRAEYIKNAPTIDAEPVKHGWWDADGYCTVCKREAIRLWANCLHIRSGDSNHCGAKMDGGNDE